MPFFSIIIPTFNRAEFLKGTIKSVLQQDFQDFELLVIDDGSTDHTAEVVRCLQSLDGKIKYYLKKNEERGAARNYGISIASGDYLVFLDSDDDLKGNHLKKLRSIILSKPNINFFAAKFNFFENGNYLDAPISRLKEGIYDYRLLLKGNPFACNICTKRENKSLVPFLVDRNYSGMEDWIFLFANLWSQDLYLYDDVTITMNEHPNRSMRFNKIIIDKRCRATEYLINKFNITPSERNELIGYSNYFCAIHAYLDQDKKKSLSYLIQATRKLKTKKEVMMMFLKVLFGREIVGKIKDIISHK